MINLLFILIPYLILTLLGGYYFLNERKYQKYQRMRQAEREETMRRRRERVVREFHEKQRNYGGNKQQPSPVNAQVEAAKFLLAHYGGYRKAVMATHPDRGGDPDAFRRVQTAKEILDRYT